MEPAAAAQGMRLGLVAPGRKRTLEAAVELLVDVGAAVFDIAEVLAAALDSAVVLLLPRVVGGQLLVAVVLLEPDGVLVVGDGSLDESRSGKGGGHLLSSGPLPKAFLAYIAFQLDVFRVALVLAAAEE